MQFITLAGVQFIHREYPCIRVRSIARYIRIINYVGGAAVSRGRYTNKTTRAASSPVPKYDVNSLRQRKNEGKVG